jgi:hypothetical protein
MRFSRYCAPWYNHVSKETVSWTRGINSYTFGTVFIILNNLKIEYSNKIKNKFGKDLDFKWDIWNRPEALNGAFPGKSVRNKETLNKLDFVTIRIMVGTDKEQYSPLHVLEVACHEIGHGLAKGRKKNWYRLHEKKIATEGESDYFAVKCMMNYFLKFGFDQSLFESIKRVDPDVKRTCEVSAEEAKCIAILQTAKDGLRAFDSNTASYLEREKDKTTETVPSHPGIQCRLDTIKSSFFGNGRPRCWHNPFIPVLHKDLSMMF